MEQQHRDDDRNDRNDRNDSRPNPDPTRLTTAQLTREVGALRELLEAKIHGTDRVVALLVSRMEELPAETTQLVKALEALHDVKFDGIKSEFILRDDRVKQSALDTKSELASALQAAEKASQKQTDNFTAATDKSERSTTKQIDAQSATQQASTSSLNDKIVALDQRVTRSEGAGTGKSSAESSQHVSNSFVVAVFAASVSLIGVVVLIIELARAHP